MHRRILVCAALFGLPLLVCSIGAWLALLPPIMLFIPPDAEDVRVSELGLGHRLLTYSAPGERYRWYVTVEARLKANQWRSPEPYGPSAQSGTYLHVTPLWPVLLWELAELHGEPHLAHITLRRWITWYWQPRYADK